MQWTEIKSGEQYKRALARTKEIFHAVPDSREENELELLLVLIKDYEDKNIIFPNFDTEESN